MKHFHIGIRVSEIVSIAPTQGKDAIEYPTSYTLKSGLVTKTTGDWKENVRKVEAILNEELPDMTSDKFAASEWLASGKKHMPVRVRRAIERLAEVPS